MEYYSAINKNEIMSFAATWMDLEINVLSEVSGERHIPYDITYMWNLKKWYKWTYLQNRNSLVGLMVDSGRAYAKEYFPELLLPVSLSPRWATANPHLCRRPSSTSSRLVDRVLVLWPGGRPEPLRWESRVQDIGPPETSWPHIISNGGSSPRDLYLNAKTQLHSMTSKLQCWTPYAKQLARQEHKPTH